jgi:hypothetical protein
MEEQFMDKFYKAKINTCEKEIGRQNFKKKKLSGLDF